MQTIWLDLRQGLRLLAKAPGFTFVTVVTLALGIGATTAIFSAINALLLRSLPFRDAGRLVRIWPTNTKTGLSSFAITSYPNFADWKEQARSFEKIEAYVVRSFNITGEDQPEHLRGLRTSDGLLQLLDVSPIVGRVFTREEVQPGRDHVVLLTEGLWQRRFGRDPGILGKNVKLNDENFAVIGILPSSFQFPPDAPSGIVLPQPPDADRGHGFLNVVARLRSGVSFSQAQAEMDAIARQQELQYPKDDKDTGAHVMSLRDSFSSNFRPALLIFSSAVGFVLLIACANVANLFLARTAGRQNEFVVRAALGAGRFRLVRQLVTESALFGFGGGVMGLLLAYWGVKGLVLLVGSTFATQAMNAVTIDLHALTFALLVSLTVGMISGLAPGLTAAGLDANDILKEGSRGLTGSRRGNRIRSALVVTEIGLALMLLVGAGLMVKTFALLNAVDPGLHAEGVLTLNFALSGKKYAETQARAPFLSAVLDRVERVPGVLSAAVVTDTPLSGDTDEIAFSVERHPDPAPGQKVTLNVNVVGPGYLRTLGIPLVKGRDFMEDDTETRPRVALINQSMARKLWPNQDPIGARISGDDKTWYTIQGVVGDVRQGGLGTEPRPEVYLSYLQDPFAWPYLTLLVRTSSDPARLVSTIQGAIWSVQKDLPISAISTMQQIRSQSIAQPRLMALLLAVFAGLALVLASVGIYGVMAYSATQRTHEMGLRMALGARREDILRMVIGQGMILTILGVGLGLAGAFPLAKVLTKFLWGVRPTDPSTFVGVALLLGAVAFTASYVPAQRATRVDPMVALRYE